MELLKQFFPHAFKVNDVTSLVIMLVIYALIDLVCGLVIGFLSSIAIIGIIFSLLGAVIGLYALVGIILSVLVFAKVIQ